MFRTKNKELFKKTGTMMYIVAFMIFVTDCNLAAGGFDGRYVNCCRYLLFAALWCASVLKGCTSEFKDTPLVISSAVALIVFMTNNVINVLIADVEYLIFAVGIVVEDMLQNFIAYSVYGATVLLTVSLYKKAEYESFLKRVYTKKKNEEKYIFPISVIADKDIVIRPAVNSDIPFFIRHLRNNPEYKCKEDFLIARNIEKIVRYPGVVQRYYAVVYRDKTIGMIEADTYILTRISIYIKPLYSHLAPEVFRHVLSSRMFIRDNILLAKIMMPRGLSNWLCRRQAVKDPSVEVEKMPDTRVISRYYCYTKYYTRTKCRQGGEQE